jgi:hypothetical protein
MFRWVAAGEGVHLSPATEENVSAGCASPSVAENDFLDDKKFGE